jgi:membrane protein
VKLKPGGGIRAFLRDYLLSFGMVLVIGFLLLVSLILTTVVSGISGWMGRLWTLPAGVWGAVTFCLSYCFIVAMFGAIFKVLPDAKVQWRQVWIGAALTGILFEIGKFALGWYLGRPSTVSTFGAASSVVLVLLWVYYASLILFYGAEFTRVYAEENGVAIQPTEYAIKTDLTPATAAAPLGPGEGAAATHPVHGTNVLVR